MTVLGSDRVQRRGRTRALSAHAVVGSAALTAGLVVRATGGHLPILVCPLHATTGLCCPFCGGTRAMAALGRGDVLAALSSNLVVTLLVPVAALVWGRLVWRDWAGAPRGASALLPRQRTVYRTLGVVLVLFTVWRNLPQLPLGAWLAP